MKSHNRESIMSQHLTVLSFFFLVFFMSQTDAAKVLLLPSPLNSHVNYFINAGQTLANAGHQAWLLTPDTFEEKIAKRGLHSITYGSKELKEFFGNRTTVITPLLAEGKVFQAMMGVMPMSVAFYQDLCHRILSDQSLMAKVKEQKFDLAIIEGQLTFVSFNIIPYKYDIPFMTLAPFISPWQAGVTSFPSYEPNFILPYSHDMDFTQRFLNTLTFMIQLWLQSDISSAQYVPNKPTISAAELSKNSEMFLLNSDATCLDFPRLQGPHYRYIGGVSVQKPKPLPNDIELFVKDAKNGVVLLSFGSNQEFTSLIKRNLHKFLDAFQQIKQKVILQIDPEYLKTVDNVPNNVKGMSWLPQNDILGHPKTVVFITHGGANGQMEAVYHGVPMISMGIMLDQIYNSERIVHHGYGKRLAPSSFTAEQLVQAIEDITTNATYKKNIQRCSEIIRSLPSAEESLTFWVDHILRFGGSHLKPHSIYMPWYKVLLLDVIVCSIVMIILVLAFLYCLCRCMFRRLCRHPQSKAKND